MHDEPIAQIAGALFFSIISSLGNDDLANSVAVLKSSLDRGLISDPTARDVLRDIVDNAVPVLPRRTRTTYRVEGNLVRLEIRRP
jgi:hypothetical protein